MTDARRSPDCPDADVLDQMLDELTDYRTVASEDQKEHYDNSMDILADLEGRLEMAEELGVSIASSELLTKYNEAADHLAKAGLNLYNFERRAGTTTPDAPNASTNTSMHSGSPV